MRLFLCILAGNSVWIFTSPALKLNILISSFVTFNVLIYERKLTVLKKESLSLSRLWILINSETVSRQKTSAKQSKSNQSFYQMCLHRTDIIIISRIIEWNRRRKSFRNGYVNDDRFWFQKNKTRLPSASTSVKWICRDAKFGVRFFKIDYVNHHFPL